MSKKVRNELRKIKTLHTPKNVFHTGYQSRLGIYFRHLYETIKFVDRQRNFLSTQQKQNYIDLLRAQMSVQEQGMVFLETISTSDFGEPVTDLIIKYQLFKDIPKGFLKRMSRSKFYPELFKS